jgi:hypothetical protein
LSEVITELSKPTWWISVVVAGLAINLISAYLKQSLDGLLARTFSWWRTISQAKRDEWTTRVQAIQASEELHEYELANEFRLRLRAINLLLLAIFLSTMRLAFGTPHNEYSKIFMFAIVAYAFFSAFLTFIKASDTEKALAEAKNK